MIPCERCTEAKRALDLPVNEAVIWEWEQYVCVECSAEAERLRNLAGHDK